LDPLQARASHYTIYVLLLWIVEAVQCCCGVGDQECAIFGLSSFAAVLKDRLMRSNAPTIVNSKL